MAASAAKPDMGEELLNLLEHVLVSYENLPGLVKHSKPLAKLILADLQKCFSFDRRNGYSSKKPPSRTASGTKIFHIGNDEAEELDEATPTPATYISTLTNGCSAVSLENGDSDSDSTCRIKAVGSVEGLERAFRSEHSLSDRDYLLQMKGKRIKHRELENLIDGRDSKKRAVALRRDFVQHFNRGVSLEQLPYFNYDYEPVSQACCENVIGYMPIPVGVAGPLKVNQRDIYIPLATTEGALVASTNRGCAALARSGGVNVFIIDDKMTRAPVVKFKDVAACLAVDKWLRDPDNFDNIKREFESDSSYAKLLKIESSPEGLFLFIKFFASTGDAMGMNMVSKGCQHAMRYIKGVFSEMEVVCLSGNYCVDKKAAAVNLIQGRGKSVVAEAVLTEAVVSGILKTSPRAMVEAARAKLEVGSAHAVTLGGQNCHAANIVAALFLASGQDVAQVVSSSMCTTRMEINEYNDLHVTCQMPVVEVGTVGGGTVLPAQKTALEMMGVAGGNRSNPGENSRELARIVCGAVLAGELSLLAALATDDLVASHMKLNRSRLNLYTNGSDATPHLSAPLLNLNLSPCFRERRDTLQANGNGRRQRRISDNRNTNCSNIL
ncbi:unnamed protein product, partial [Mesorhabditis spiculigera]